MKQNSDVPDLTDDDDFDLHHDHCQCGTVHTCRYCSTDDLDRRDEDEDAYPVQELLQPEDAAADKDPVDEQRRRSYNKLRAIHKNLGHPSNSMLMKILREAGAPKHIIDMASELRCDVCSRFKSISPAKPAKSHHFKQLGECLGIDVSFFRRTEEDKKTAMLLHLVDEASKFHVVKVIREGIADTDNALGNLKARELVDELRNSWFRYFQTPQTIHTDSEGVFRSDEFKDLCNQRGIRIITTAGEAHWQLGVVERHIRTVSETMRKLVLDQGADVSLQDIADQACEAKNSYGNYGGYSPAQWHLSRSHPLTKTNEVPPDAEGDPFIEHLHRRKKAAQAFIEAEARTMLRLASNARARELKTITPGDVVYYWRVGKAAGAKAKGRHRGPARVLAVEPPEGEGSKATSIVWISHGTSLIRAAPEHLRQATPLEIRLEEFVHGPSPGNSIHRTLQGKRKGKYLDLGPPPSEAERNRSLVEDDDGDDRPDADAPEPKRRRQGDVMPFRPEPPSSSLQHPPSPDDDAISIPSRPRTPSRSDSDWYHKSKRPAYEEEDIRSRSERRAIREVNEMEKAEQRQYEQELFGPDPTPDDKSMGSRDPDEADMDKVGERRPPPPATHIRRDPFADGLEHMRPFDNSIDPSPSLSPPLPSPLRPGASNSTAPVPPAPAATPPAPIPTTSLHAEATAPIVDPSANAQSHYSYYLHEQQRKHNSTYIPYMTIGRKSKNLRNTRRNQWSNYVFEYELDVYEDDLNYFREETNDERIVDQFAHMTSEMKRHAEVNLKFRTPAEKGNSTRRSARNSTSG